MPPSGHPRFVRHAAPRTVGRLGGLASPAVGRAVAAELPGRQVTQADLLARGRLTRDRAAKADLQVVGVWSEDQQIHRHHAPGVAERSQNANAARGISLKMRFIMTTCSFAESHGARRLPRRIPTFMGGYVGRGPTCGGRIHIVMVSRAAHARSRPFVARLFRAGCVVAALWCSSGQSPLPGAVSSQLIDTTRLLADLRTLSSDQMAGRAMGTAGGARARAHLVERFRAVGLQAFPGGFEQPFVGLPPGAGRAERPGGVNVVGYVPGIRAPSRYLVISAHYDHVGTRDGQVFNGANDNASGAAALAVMAEHFVRHRPETTMIFVAFDGEEVGMLGSRAFVRAPPVPRDALLLNVNADMIGRDASETLYVSGVALYPYFKPFVSRVAASAPVRLMMGYDAPGAPGKDNWTLQSDQWAFIEAGIPALYLGVEDYKDVHRPDDDYESMMPTFYVGAVETVIALLREFDTGADEIAASRRAAAGPATGAPTR